jgi:hypothetical protein
MEANVIYDAIIIHPDVEQRRNGLWGTANIQGSVVIEGAQHIIDQTVSVRLRKMTKQEEGE